jgi:hypothetical protein
VLLVLKEVKAPLVLSVKQVLLALRVLLALKEVKAPLALRGVKVLQGLMA